MKLQEPAGKIETNPPEKTGQLVTPAEQPKVTLGHPEEVPQD